LSKFLTVSEQVGQLIISATKIYGVDWLERFLPYTGFCPIVADQISNIFGLLHSDLHEERAVAVLEYMSSMVASVDPYHHSADGQKGCLGDSFSQQNLTKGKFNVRSKRRNGRVRV